QSLDWHLLQYKEHEGIRLLLRDLNRLYESEPALGRNDLNPEAFLWINAHDADNSVLTYIRRDPATGAQLVVAGNYTPVARGGYRVGVPAPGFYRERINTNSRYYGGTGEGNDGGRASEPVPANGFAQSLLLNLPPRSTTIFKREDAV
ncbi:MAG: alpha amylase C-terminal domain-containing protein, partial [Opitutaceae bacterium]|nr:alpha amylase C-terminal domain-containing protein [Opitutaceae bacterium]